MGFMELDIERGSWLVGEQSGHVMPADEIVTNPVPGPLSADRHHAAYDYVGFITGESIDIVVGVAWRLSAPGYMDCTDWTIADRPDESRAFREACDENDDICIHCGATDSTGERDDGMPFCESCVPAHPWVLDTALSVGGANHDVTNGKAWLVTFGDDSDACVVTSRYTDPDEDDAIDIAAGWLVEQHPEHYLDEESGEQSEDETAPGYVTHETMMERCIATLDEATRLAVRYADGACGSDETK